MQINVKNTAEGFSLTLYNQIHECEEYIDSEIVILCTGFQNVIPSFLEPLLPRIQLDTQNRFNFNKSYSIHWNGPRENCIYALNFSRHQHGIIDPQTNLMAWRSGVVVNDLAQEKIYQTDTIRKNFVEYDRITSQRQACVQSA